MRPGLVLSIDGLPPKPKDLGGRIVKWVLLAQSPGFVYQDHMFQVDEDFISAQLRDFASLTKSGYRPPLLREHTRNGERSGDVLELSSTVIDGRPALIGAVAFSDPEAEDKIKRGEVKYVSPAFGPLQDDEGREYDFVLREVSLVAAPHQKNLSPGVSHVLGSEQVIDMKGKETTPAPILEEEVATAEPTVEDRLAGLETSVSYLLELLAEQAAPAEEEEAGEAMETSETTHLMERINVLEEERDRAVWDKAQPAILRWTPELGEVLFGVWRENKDQLSAVLSEASVEAPEGSPARAEPVPVNPFAVRMSEPSGPPQDGPTSDEDLSSEALRIADGDQSKALAIYSKLKSQTLN